VFLEVVGSVLNRKACFSGLERMARHIKQWKKLPKQWKKLSKLPKQWKKPSKLPKQWKKLSKLPKQWKKLFLIDATEIRKSLCSRLCER